MDSAAQRPIFILGSPRSRTTLMREILTRHPAIAICNETHFFPLVYYRRKAFGDLADSANRRRLVVEYLKNRYIQRAELDTPEIAERLLTEGVSYQAFFTILIESYSRARGKRRFGEKTPRHSLYVKTLCDWYPNAIILHMVRDPRAAVASMLHMGWARVSVVMNARRWANLSDSVRKFRHHPGYIEVRYEDLVADPEKEMRRLCSFIDEEYEPAIIQGKGTFIASRETSAQTSISADRVNAWQRELDPAHIAQIEWTVGPRLRSYGYTAFGAPASKLTIVRGVAFAAFDYLRASIFRLPTRLYRRLAPTKIQKFQEWKERKPAWSSSERPADKEED